jgi:hypothetical protein
MPLPPPHQPRWPLWLLGVVLLLLLGLSYLYWVNPVAIDLAAIADRELPGG